MRDQAAAVPFFLKSLAVAACLLLDLLSGDLRAGWQLQVARGLRVVR